MKEHVGGEEEKTSVSNSLKNTASVFANLLVAEKEKAAVKAAVKKGMGKVGDACPACSTGAFAGAGCL